jgi:hypothetical protein
VVEDSPSSSAIGLAGRPVNCTLAILFHLFSFW